MAMFDMYQFKTDFTNNDKHETMKAHLCFRDNPLSFFLGVYKYPEDVPQFSFVHRNFISGQCVQLETEFKESKALSKAFAIFSSCISDQKNVCVMLMTSAKLSDDFLGSDFYEAYDWQVASDDTVLAFCQESSRLNDSYQLLCDKVVLK
jgi:hypothetical protein